MLTLILLAVSAVGLILWGVLATDSFITTIGAVFGFALVCCLLTLINIGNRFDEEKENYMNLKMQVDDYNALPDSCKLVSFEYDIRKDVLRMNNGISRHKVMSRSPWVNVWHSRELGDLEKLRVYGPTEQRKRHYNKQ